MVACLIGLADNHTRDRRSTRRLVMPSYRETSSGLRRLECDDRIKRTIETDGYYLFSASPEAF